MMSGKPSPKVVEPIIQASAPQPVISPQIQNATVSPIPASMMSNVTNSVETSSSGGKPEDTLQDVRARFMEGRVVSPVVSTESAPVASALPKNTFTAPASLGGPISPKTIQDNPPAINKGLSPHTQAGMIPTTDAFPSPSVIEARMPIAQTVKPAVPASQPLSSFAQGQKISVVSGGFPKQHASMVQMRPQQASGRKLLGFFMFATGIVFGAVIMHAYLNGYLDPVISQVMDLVKKVPMPGS
jgi:hypothetical protein